MKTGPISPEDYREPRCLLDCGPERESQSVPQRRIQEKLDEYMAKRDYPGAERHLLYWQEEARQGSDLRGQLLICNELIGFYRKTGEQEKAFSACCEARNMLDALSFRDNLSAGTTYVNIATAYSAFERDEEALALFSKARRIYEALPDTSSELLGGLYNNMGLAYAVLGRYIEAHHLFDLAMEQMRRTPGGELEQAITCLNRADAVNAEQGGEGVSAEIKTLLAQAKELILTAKAPRDGYFAFVCEKCAPGFRYYGEDDTAKELEQLAEELYARS